MASSRERIGGAIGDAADAIVGAVVDGRLGDGVILGERHGAGSVVEVAKLNLVRVAASSAATKARHRDGGRAVATVSVAADESSRRDANLLVAFAVLKVSLTHRAAPRVAARVVAAAHSFVHGRALNGPHHDAGRAGAEAAGLVDNVVEKAEAEAHVANIFDNKCQNRKEDGEAKERGGVDGNVVTIILCCRGDGEGDNVVEAARGDGRWEQLAEHVHVHQRYVRRQRGEEEEHRRDRVGRFGVVEQRRHKRREGGEGHRVREEHPKHHARRAVGEEVRQREQRGEGGEEEVDEANKAVRCDDSGRAGANQQ